MARDHNGDVVSQDDYREPMYDMGEVGLSAVENIRKQREKQTLQKAEDTDKDHRVCDSQDEAIAFAKTIGVTFKKRPSAIAQKELRTDDGQNPTVEYLLKRMFGINSEQIARMIPTNDDKWCVYWRPSLVRHSPANVIVTPGA